MPGVLPALLFALHFHTCVAYASEHEVYSGAEPALCVATGRTEVHFRRPKAAPVLCDLSVQIAL